MKHAREDYDNIQEITTNGTTRKIPADEPVFLIRAQDAVGAAAVRAWATLAEAAGAAKDIIKVALDHADKMDAWPKKKVADLPEVELDPKVGEALGKLAKSGVSITRPVISRSYPYLSIAKHFDLDYGDVLIYAQWAMNPVALWHADPITREVVMRLQKEINVIVQKDFVAAVKHAISEWRRMQREGWD